MVRPGASTSECASLDVSFPRGWMPPCRGSRVARMLDGDRLTLALLELLEHLGIADVDPASLNGQADDAQAGGDHRADGVGEFVFAAGRFLESGGVIEHHGSEQVDPGVVPDWLAGLEFAGRPKFGDLSWGRFFDEPAQAEVVVEEVEAAFGDVLAFGNGQQSGERRRTGSVGASGRRCRLGREYRRR